MTPERWQQVDELFHSALAREPSQRAAFLADACTGDAEIRSQVESLLESHDQAANFIELPASDIAAELLADRPELKAGQEISHYTVMTFLGKGGMGEVYLAQDTRLDRHVALKLLPAQFTVDAASVKRFEQEARAASALNHPNIVTVYDIGESNSSHFIATEFIDGITLGKRLANGQMRLDEILGIATQAASALATAHEGGIVHRDVKPENIMMRRDGLVKVLDFGLAKLTSIRPLAVDRADPVRVKTNPGVLLGTVKYMSPEQTHGDDVDNRTDLWSLGVVLYEMVTGRTPFGGETPSHTIISILENQQPPLSHYAEAPPELERIVQKLLRKDRRERYQTAGDLALDLKSLKQELEIKTRLKQAGPETGGPSPTKKSAELPAAAANPSASAGRNVDTAPERHESNAGYIAVTIKRHKFLIALAAAVTIVVGSALSSLFFNRSGRVIDSLAVLPFENASGDPEVESLLDGIPEGIINRLSGPLNVKSFNAVRHYKGRQIEAQGAGHELNVGAVLTGRIVQGGEILIVSTELIDTRDGRQLWGQRFNHKRSALITLQDDIAQEIPKKLGLHLSRDEETQLTRHYTENADAEELDMKGRLYFNKRTVDGINRSKEYFRGAIGKDPSYPLPYSGLANSLTPSDLVLAPRGARSEAMDAAATALGLDNTLAEAHTAQARVLLFFDMKWTEAEDELQLTLKSHPNNAEAHHMYSHYLMYVGETQKSLDQAREAWKIDKDDPLLNVHLGWTYLYARHYADAIEQMRKAIEMDHSFFRAHLFLGRAYEESRMYKEALDEYNEARQLERGSQETLPLLGHLYAVSHDEGRARSALKELRALYDQNKASAYDLAIVCAGLGENDMALTWLEKALKERTGGILMLKVEPIFDKLHGNLRYAKLLREMNLEIQ